MSDQRYPINIRPIGLMYKTKAKLYMTSVLWSDDSDIIVYRSSLDFKQLHEQLKKRFRAEVSPGKSKRLIPKFKDGMVQVTRKGPNKSMVRLRYLEKYFDQLLKCDPLIMQSAELAQFFLPNAQDLEPEFSKNSVIVMPSEDLHYGEEQLGRGNVSQPFVSKVYQCVAPYETKDTKNRPFSVAVDEKVDVLIKDKAGWWLVENSNKCMAWFPAPYLEMCKEEDEEDKESETLEEGVLHCALRNFTSSKADELSVSIGAVVEVLQKSDNGWWLIRYKGKVGYVPSMYLRSYTNPKVRFVTMAKELRNSALNLLSVAPGTGHGSHGDLATPDFSPADLRVSVLSACRPMPSLPEPCSHSTLPIIRVEEEEEETRGAERAWLADQQASLGSDWGSDSGSNGSSSRGSSSRGSSDSGSSGNCSGSSSDSGSSGSSSNGSSSGNSSDSGSSGSSGSSDSGSSGNCSGSSSDSGSSGSEHNLSDDSSGAMNTEAWRVRRQSLTSQRPTVTPDDQLVSFRSETHLFKGPVVPKVPPRPHTQEILSRCTTITRQAAQSYAKTRITLMQSRYGSR